MKYPESSISNVRYVAIIRHAKTNPGEEGLNPEGIKKAQVTASIISERIPIEVRDQADKILLIISSKRRAMESGNPFCQEFNVTPIEIDYMPHGVLLSKDLLSMILEEIKPTTLSVVVIGHSPQIDKLPKLFFPHLEDPYRGVTEPGDGYIIDIQKGVWEPVYPQKSSIEVY